MQYIQIVNHDKYQHYKDRTAPWVKLHKGILTSRTWIMLDSDSRVLMIALMVLGCETGNKIPFDAEYVKRRAFLKKIPDFQPLLDVDFIAYYSVSNDSMVLENDTKCSQKVQTARREERRGEESRTEREQNRTDGTSAPVVSSFSFSRLHRGIRQGLERHRPTIRQPIDSEVCAKEAAFVETMQTTAEFSEIADVLKWLFMSGHDCADFWKKHVKTISDLAKVKKGETESRWEKVLETYRENNEPEEVDEWTQQIRDHAKRINEAQQAEAQAEAAQ